MDSASNAVTISSPQIRADANDCCALVQVIYTYINNEARTMLAVRLPIEIERRLDALAKATGRTKTFYVREAILEHLEDLEDLYLAEREVKAVRAGKSKTISLEKLMKQYGLED